MSTFVEEKMRRTVAKKALRILLRGQPCTYSDLFGRVESQEHRWQADLFKRLLDAGLVERIGPASSPLSKWAPVDADAIEDVLADEARLTGLLWPSRTIVQRAPPPPPPPPISDTSLEDEEEPEETSSSGDPSAKEMVELVLKALAGTIQAISNQQKTLAEIRQEIMDFKRSEKIDGVVGQVSGGANAVDEKALERLEKIALNTEESVEILRRLL